MTNIPSSNDAQAYLENLMRAGQDAMKQFDDALASAAGVKTEDSLSSGRMMFPFALVADLQREYLKQLWHFWNATFLSTFARRRSFRHRAGAGRQAVQGCILAGAAILRSAQAIVSTGLKAIA